jgi:Ca2+-binding RTX toxin-like protein
MPTMGVVGLRLALPALLVTAALAWPASSMAASGSLVDGVMDYQGGGDANAVTFQLVDRGFDQVYQVVDQPTVSIAAAAPCFNDNGQQNIMDCPVDGGFTNVPVKIFTASLGDANDTITLLANLPTSIGAGGGADTMRGGPADDALRGGQGADNIDGSSGNDTIIGDDPIDPSKPATLDGGNDVISGGLGNDTIDGEAGADDLRGYLGDDTLNGGDGNDIVRANLGADGNDVVNGGSGVDTATYDERAEPLTLSLDDVANDGSPGTGSDNIHTDVENLVGGASNDILSGSNQPNTLDGGPGNDTESGGDGADAVDGGDGDDNLGGEDGDDTVSGGTGSDAVGGGAGNDALRGDDGEDRLDGGTGADDFSGGNGSDLADYSSRSQGVAVKLDDVPGDGEFGENDNVRADVENVNGGGGPDTLIGSGTGNALDGGAGEDYSDGGAGSDTLTGGDAGDVLRSRGASEADTINCGPGPDFVIAKANDVIASDCDRADRGVNQRPKRRDSALVTPVNGSLQMSPTGIVRRVPLQDKVVLPLRSIVDTVAGQVKVASAPTSRKIETATLEDGAFDITQSSAKNAITQFALKGGDFSVCPTPAGRRASASAGKKSSTKTVRVLWANSKGKFRTKGRYASATVRGTKWQTVDRCDGTLIKVERGAVSVRDTVKKKIVVVKAGDSYVAKR